MRTKEAKGKAIAKEKAGWYNIFSGMCLRKAGSPETQKSGRAATAAGPTEVLYGL